MYVHNLSNQQQQLTTTLFTLINYKKIQGIVTVAILYITLFTFYGQGGLL